MERGIRLPQIQAYFCIFGACLNFFIPQNRENVWIFLFLGIIFPRVGQRGGVFSPKFITIKIASGKSASYRRLILLKRKPKAKK